MNRARQLLKWRVRAHESRSSRESDPTRDLRLEFGLPLRVSSHFNYSLSLGLSQLTFYTGLLLILPCVVKDTVFESDQCKIGFESEMLVGLFLCVTCAPSPI